MNESYTRQMVFLDFEMEVINKGYRPKDIFMDNNIFYKVLEAYIKKLPKTIKEEYREIIIEEKNKWVDERLEKG